ncbi:MAG TPA: ABC transporter permease subunit [Treponemataceae bacterium]|nr:ABC transporter permease subunit [Treponemataceae bacterium]
MKWLIDFPFEITINKKAIDSAVRSFSVKHDAFFSAITSGLNGLIGGIHSLLNIIPWWLFILAIFFAGWKSTGKLKNGIVFALAITVIGIAGLWALMLETLSIIIAAVIISLFFGLPLGILLAQFDRAEKIARPVLDTMQTMPVFVYLIPALLFFGLGKAPAVIATTIYAIVPVIRLTSLGIRQVDKEVVEAAKAFGSTGVQTLIKVQIPQAKATIMTGVNQTLMMAMAMVVTCSMIGASGLGMEVLMGVQRIEIGRGLIAGIAVVILAIVLDRITQGIAEKGQKNGKQ